MSDWFDREDEEEQEPEWFDVAAEEDLQEGQGKLVFAKYQKLALFRVGGQVVCIQNNCPHAGAFLAYGVVEGELVRCPRHDWKFDLISGDCLTNPRYCVKTFETKIEEGRVWVAVPPEPPRW